MTPTKKKPVFLLCWLMMSFFLSFFLFYYVFFSSLGIVDWPVALAMAVPSLLMTGFGARHARSLNDSKLRLVLGCTLLILCPLIALKDGKEQKEEEPSEGDNKKDGVEEKEREGSSFGEQLEALQKKLDANHFIKDKNLLSLPIPARRALAFANAYGDYLCLGLFSGYSSGLLGIGGGILMTAYMSLKGDMTQLAAVATSLAAIVPIGISLFSVLFFFPPLFPSKTILIHSSFSLL